MLLGSRSEEGLLHFTHAVEGLFVVNIFACLLCHPNIYLVLFEMMFTSGYERFSTIK
jgi:hypothetical protein